MDNTLPLPSPLQAPVARMSSSRWPLALGFIVFVPLAVASGGSLVLSGAGALRALAPLAVACGLAAYIAESATPRRHTAFTPGAAPAFYVAGALVLPAPWAVLVAAGAAFAHYLTARAGSVAARAVAAAHTVLVVSVFTMLVHLLAGDETVLRGAIAVLVGLPSALVAGTTGAHGAAAGMRVLAPHVPDTGVLVALVPLYYLLDTVPRVAASALLHGVAPGKAWRDVYAHTALPELGLLGVSVFAVAAYGSVHALALLALPAVVGLHRAILEAGARRAAEGEARALHGDVTVLDARATTARQQAEQSRAYLGAVLSSVQAVSGADDLGGVTETLVKVVRRLTPFQVCTVYLYESREGVFVPHAGNHERTLRGAVEPRGRVETLMSERHRLGYSYYIPIPRAARAGLDMWSAGDVLLVPLLLTNGDVAGYILLDRPADNRVPTPADLAPLETVSSLAASMIARLRHTDEALRLAATDGLTGLLNRRMFEERLRQELASAARRDDSVALMMIDIDDFGSVNNRYGHQVGDAALRLVAGIIREHLRESDAGGRYGGDEFAAILPGLTAAGAADIAERLRAALATATTRAAADGALPQIYTSIGVASCADDTRDSATLVKAADDALYQSKRLGKNRVSIV